MSYSMKNKNNVHRLLKVIPRAFILMAGLAIIFSGCVGSKKFAEVQDKRDQLQADLSACQQKSNALQSQLTEARQSQDAELASLKEENDELEGKLSDARSSIAKLSSELANCPSAISEGVYFKVQVGAFREREVPESLDESVNLAVEQKNDMQEIVVGQFRDYFKADELQNQLRAMGVSDAWIVAYRDGQRVPLKEVIDQIREE